jgi:spermidine synthase
MRGYNASLYRSFRCVFDNALLLPGSHALLIGSRNAQRMETNPDSLYARFVRCGVAAEYFSGGLFDELLSRDRASFVERELSKDSSIQTNTDDTPVAYFYNMMLWTRSVQADTRLMERLSMFSRTRVVGIAGGMLLIILAAAGKRRRQHTAAALIMFIVGFAGIAFTFLLLLNFQVVFGSIFELMGMLLAAHMAGIATGALIVGGWKTSWRVEQKLAAVIVLAILFALLFPFLSRWIALTRAPFVSYGAMAVSGIFGGAVFALTNTFSLLHSGTTGAIYAADMLGASLGALLVSSMLLPLWGMTGLSLTLAALLAFSLLLLIALRSPGHP